jgi:hypothetical protein
MLMPPFYNIFYRYSIVDVNTNSTFMSGDVIFYGLELMGDLPILNIHKYAYIFFNEVS